MKHRLVLFIFCLLALMTTGVVVADDGGGNAEDDHFALSLGVGVVEPDGEGEIYFHGGFRFRVGGDGEDDDYDHDYEKGERRQRSSRSGDNRDERAAILAFVEPEIGYWEQDQDFGSDSDFLVGVNAIGVVPGRRVDYFFGVGLGVHFLDVAINDATSAVRSSESETAFGGNFQVGLDINFTDSVAVFGAGRFDVLEGADDNFQAKVYVGLRFNF